MMITSTATTAYDDQHQHQHQHQHHHNHHYPWTLSPNSPQLSMKPTSLRQLLDFACHPTL
jgi:hypothetical protein